MDENEQKNNNFAGKDGATSLNDSYLDLELLRNLKLAVIIHMQMMNL